jgi:hypothetical protein
MKIPLIQVTKLSAQMMIRRVIVPIRLLLVTHRVKVLKTVLVMKIARMKILKTAQMKIVEVALMVESAKDVLNKNQKFQKQKKKENLRGSYSMLNRTTSA